MSRKTKILHTLPFEFSVISLKINKLIVEIHLESMLETQFRLKW